MSEADLVEEARGFADLLPLSSDRTIIIQLADEVERLRKALEFYADPENYREQLQNAGDCAGINWMLSDNGGLARAALHTDDPSEGRAPSAQEEKR